MQQIHVTLSIFFTKMYNKAKTDSDKKKVLSFLMRNSASKYAFLKIYEQWVRDELLIKIEYLCPEEKTKLVSKVRSCYVFSNNKETSDAARIIHTLFFINSNS